MSNIVSIASIARHAQAAARRGQPRDANPYPPADPAHAIWADCHAAAAACAGCDRAEAACLACGPGSLRESSHA